ncbi:hypothetical protein GE061_014252 [Apolygus lucorum]|uniref:Major facilitator superfamily (MFS) profile domain-containing protein n=1 Tax=Apolygus lucorum TaxID=248454 RepID=A0A8S9XSD6_APOLU|nr:hypothetical protein GE061_014252 [Apolygus lucorum]
MTMSTSEKSDPGCWSRYRLTVEPIMALAFSVISLTGSPFTDLCIEKACGQLGLDVDTCKNDEISSEKVHRTTSTITLWRIIIDTLPGCIMSLFISPWSETNGRKPAIIVSLIGMTLSQGAIACMSTIKSINPYWYLIAGIPSSLSGGAILTILGCYCYMIDVSSPKDRIIRLAVLNEFVAVAAVITSLLAPGLENLGYPAVFGTSTALLATALLHALFFLPESIQIEKEKSATLFTTDHLVDSFKTFLKKRPNNVRGAIFALTGVGVISLLAATGEPDNKYLATIKKFNWTISDYSTYTAVGLVVQALGTLSGVYILMNILKLGEAASILIIEISLLLSSLLTAFATTPTMFYITSQLRIFFGSLGPLMKGFISKLLPPHDIAKVLAFGSTLEAFMPQIGAVLYANLYNATVGIDPFAIFLLSAFLQSIVLILTIIAIVRLNYGMKNNGGKMDMDQEKGDTEVTVMKDVEVAFRSENPEPLDQRIS